MKTQKQKYMFPICICQYRLRDKSRSKPQSNRQKPHLVENKLPTNVLNTHIMIFHPNQTNVGLKILDLGGRNKNIPIS